MSRRDDRASLSDMLSHAQEAVKLLDAMSPQELAANRVLQLALTRLVEIIGEAANRVSQSAQAQYSQIPWSQIISMRNRLIHGYDVIDYEILWNTITVDLPVLIALLQAILDDNAM